MIKVPIEETRKRFQKLRNYEHLHPKLKERYEKVKTENKRLKERLEQLEFENKQIERLELQLEELRAMKFGKQREQPQITKLLPEQASETEREAEKKKRSAESYRRAKPSPEKITDHLRMEIETCSECEEELIEKKEHTHYREDLYEVENLLKSAKKIVETIVESGKCPKCGKKEFAMEIPKQEVTIGQNIRIMTVYMMIIQGQSYSEAIRSMKHQYGIEISKGQMVNILEEEANLVTPYYNHIVEQLEQEEASHYDETSWKTKSQGTEISEGNYCWIKIGVQSQNQLIWFGRSRGKGVAEKLRGERERTIGVTDDYGSYRTLFERHQLCWAHPHRKLRELAESNILSQTIKKVCQKAYKDFSKLYQKSRRAREKLQSAISTNDQNKAQQEKLEKLFDSFCEPNTNDPEKLQTIRNSLQKRKEKYFTFCDYPSLPLDNNKAERAIRKIVIKRKKSFGCRSPKGANVLSILYSVVFSLTETNPNTSFFDLYQHAIEFEPQ